jgi:tetratricopeptide (TPR) repeat protein
MRLRVLVAGALAGGLGLAALGLAAEQPVPEGKIPITTPSEEARELFLKGRDLAEKLRATDAREYFKQAVAKDEGFALAWLGLANTSQSAKEFWDSLGKAKTHAAKVSEGERQLILGLDAGVRSDPATQGELYTKLTATYPNDERAFNLLGGYHFGRQEYQQAIAAYDKALAINPQFSQPYNQKGYAHRFLGQYDEAEAAFKKYIELIPNDPNPYDSYAELLMKRGRFEESIASYEKALEQDPHFVASYIGIGLDRTYLGQPEKGRESFKKLGEIARTSGEKRAALFGTAQSYVFEGAFDQALEAVHKMYAIAEAEDDKATLIGDLTLMGNILLEAGKPDEAMVRFTKAVAMAGQARIPAETRQAIERNALFNEGRVLLARGDVAGAQTKAAEYASRVGQRKVPFEVRQSHELLGRVALAQKDHARAVVELQQANQQDPRVLYLLALAYQGKGDKALARETCEQAAHHNSLNFNYAYVRGKAQKLLQEL